MQLKISALLGAVVFVVLGGCSGGQDAPKNAYRPPSPPPAAAAHKGPWTNQDKIDAVEKSGMPPDQKKKTIEQINAGKL